MADMSDIMKNARDENGSIAEKVPNPNFGMNQALKESGLNVDDLPSTQEVKKEAPVTAEDFEKLITDDRSPQVTPEQIANISKKVPKEEPVAVEADAGDETKWVKLSPETNYGGIVKDREARDAKEKTNVLDLIDEANADEEKRLKKAIEVTSDKEKFEQLMEGTPVAQNGTPNVQYESSHSVGQRVNSGRFAKKEFNPIADNTEDVAADLIPSYSDDDSNTSAADEEPDVNDTEGYSQYIRNLEVASIDAGETPVRIVKDRQLEAVPAKRDKAKYLGDQAFMNAITKFKKDNFTVVSVPLVNSGFTVDMVGTGVVDLMQLYGRVNEDTSQMDYEIEKMRAVMKNVVGTRPHVDSMQLRNYIHYRDYNMMAWGLICATLDKVEIVTNCSECGKPFRITASPRALLMNMEEIMKRQTEIEASDSINDYSLLTSNRKFVSSNMFEITIGHPTYSELINGMSQIRNYATGMNQIESTRFLNLAPTLYQIRSIKLPNGTITSNIYQIYLAIQMLTESDMAVLDNEVEIMTKEIIEPKFGIATVNCPHCKHTMKDIPYESLDELVFLHSTVSRILLAKTTTPEEEK